LFLPCGDFVDETLWIVDSTVQALCAEHADLDLDRVEPTGMLGGVVELEAAQNSRIAPAGAALCSLGARLRM
jgi:hypothetical protein